MLVFPAATSRLQAVSWNHQHYVAYRSVRGQRRARTIIRGF